MWPLESSKPAAEVAGAMDTPVIAYWAGLLLALHEEPATLIA